MKAKFFATVVSIFLLTGATFSGVLSGAPSVQETEIFIQRSDDQFIEVDFQFSGISIKTVDHGLERYDLISLESEGISGVIGAPEVPLITRLFAIPDRAGVRIVSVEPEFKTYTNVYPYPHQEYEYGSPHNNLDWTIDDDYYRNGKIFPQKWVTLGEPAILRDFRIIPVTISPIRVNAATCEAKVLTGLRLVLEFKDGSATNIKTRHFNKTVSSFDRLYRNIIANYDWTNPNGAEVKGSILVIYPNVSGVAGILAPYVEWKKRRGYNTLVQMVPNNTSTSTVMNYIIDAYWNADPPLEHVILVGDAAGAIDIPCFYEGSGWYNGSTDHNYTQLEGGDILADITIGRLSVDNTTTLQIAINKILYYESSPIMTYTNWYKEGAVVAGSGLSGWSTVQVNQNIRQWWLESGFTQVDTLWYNMGGSVYSFMSSQCNGGISALNYRGWVGCEGFTTSSVYALNNPFRLPFAVIITCGTGDFGSSGADMCEAWLRAGTLSQPKGGIGGVGTATMGTDTRHNNTMAAGLWFGVHREGLTELGPAVFRGKLEIFAAYQQDWNGLSNFTYWNNLMGDPTTDLWTDVPQILTVTHPDSIPVGAASFTVTVEDEVGNPLQGRYVCLWKGDETYVGAPTDENGVFTTPINVTTEGELKVTVTRHNDYPYMADVPVYTAEVNPSFHDLTIIDDNSGSSQGNGDGSANPSEILELAVELKNFGTSTDATGVSATLSSADPHVTVTGDNVGYPDIAPGAVVSGTNNFVVQLGSEFPQGYVILFELSVESDQGTFISAFDFEVNSGETIPVGQEITGGTLEPGDTDEVVITLRNVGQLDLTGVTAVLSSTDEQITIEDSTGTFGAITAGAEADNSSDPFVVTVDEWATIGRTVIFSLQLTSTNSCQQSMLLRLPIGEMSTSDPFGPDGYGYYCMDNTDVSYTGHPVYEWMDIDPANGGSGAQIYLPDWGENLDVSRAIRLPFSFTFYGESSDTLTVCSNGWIALGNEAYHDDFRNYPLPSAFGPLHGMICPFWDDLVMGGGGVYQYHDETNHRFIVQYSWVDHINWGSQPEAFQVILYDPAHHPTPTGDGEIVCQYNTITIVEGPGSDNDYFTTGIQNHEHSDGLQYAYWNVYNPGAPYLSNGMAIKFTTIEPVRTPLSNSVEITMTPVNPPIVIPSSGGSFNYDVSVTNTGNSTAIFDFWLMTTLPNGQPYGPLMGRNNLDLPAGGSIQRTLTQYVPPRAPSGEYTYTGCVGDYHDSIIWDEDSFNFTKSGINNGGIGDWFVSGWDDEEAVPGEIALPTDYQLSAAAPNPFNPSTEISYALPKAGIVTLEVYNTLGRKVAVLEDGWKNAGWHKATFKALNLSSGLYFYTLKANDFTQTRKMLLVK